MTTLVDQLPPTWDWPQIEAAVLAIPLQRFTAALRFGLSDEDGCRMARAMMADDLRRELSRPRTDPATTELPKRIEVR